MTDSAPAATDEVIVPVPGANYRKIGDGPDSLGHLPRDLRNAWSDRPAGSTFRVSSPINGKIWADFHGDHHCVIPPGHAHLLPLQVFTTAHVERVPD